MQQPFAQTNDRRGVADHPGLEIDRGALRLPQPVQLATKPAGLYRPVEDRDKVIGVIRLFEEVMGAAPHGIDGQSDVAVARQQNDRQVGIVGTRGIEQRHAVHPGHANVGDEGVEAPPAEDGNRIRSARGRQDLEA